MRIIKSKMSIESKIGIALLIVLIIFFFSTDIYKTFIYTHLTKSTSPNMENVVIVKKKEAFLLGSNPVKLTFKKTGINQIRNFKNYKTKISNNGSICEELINIEWIDNNKAIVTLRGGEQRDEVIEINFEKNIYYDIR